jgi:sigma-B regulation protein RsbU (phosphoserine phosphatase)
MSDAAARILVCAHEMTPLAELRRLLAAGGHDATGHLLGTPDPELDGHQLIVVDASRADADGLALCRRLHDRLEPRVVPILYVTDDHSPAARLACFEAGADTYLLRPFAPGEVLAQVKALLRIKDTHDRLAEKTAEVHRINKRLQAAYQQIDQELELAQRIQSSFLPQTLPEVPRGRFAVHYLLCGRVGGDFYDVFRLDENHVGFYVADAMGHGVPASLLTIFVKKGIRAKEVFGNQYRLVPPGEVLSRLNKDLIEQQLSENPFITIVYGLLNFRDGTLHFARAGHPYPLYVPRDGAASYWQVEGLLLGVVDATFPQRTHPLKRGDKVLFYSDGIDSAAFDGREPGGASLLACAERHRELPVREFVGQVARDLFGTGKHPDDLTLLGLEILE